MIFKVEFPDRKEYAQAKNLEALQQGYKQEIGDGFLSVKAITIIEDEVAKNIKIKDVTETNKHFSLYEMVCGDDFVIVSSNDFDYIQRNK